MENSAAKMVTTEKEEIFLEIIDEEIRKNVPPREEKTDIPHTRGRWGYGGP